MIESPADAIVDTHLPWFKRPLTGKIWPAKHGMFLDREDWPYIERALNAAGFVVVHSPDAAAAAMALPPPPAPAIDAETLRMRSQGAGF